MRTSMHAARTKTVAKEHNFSSNTQQALCWISSMFDQTLFARLATPRCVKRVLRKVQSIAIPCGIHTFILSIQTRSLYDANIS